MNSIVVLLFLCVTAFAIPAPELEPIPAPAIESNSGFYTLGGHEYDYIPNLYSTGYVPYDQYPGYPIPALAHLCNNFEIPAIYSYSSRTKYPLNYIPKVDYQS